MRRKANTILTGLFLLLIFSPAINNNTKVFREASLPEYRLTDEVSSFSLRHGWDFPNEYERYYNKNFGFRNALIKINTIIKLRYLKSINPIPQVLIGKGGYLFYVSEKTEAHQGHSIDDYEGRVPYSDEQLLQMKQCFKEQHHWLEKRGIEYLIVVCPEKHSIYPEYLPENIRRFTDKTGLDQLMDCMNADSTIHIIDLRKKLLKAKGEFPTYYKTDSHWNNYGAYVGYQEIMRQLSFTHPDLKPLSLADYDITVTSNNGFGDLAKMLAMQGMFKDEEVKFTLKRDTQLEQRNQKKIKKLVIFHDSFWKQIRPFISNHFDKVVDRTSGFDSKLIEREKPDIVVFERTERSLQFI